MTNREFYNLVLSANLSADITDHARKALEQMDIESASRRSKNSAKRAEANAPLIVLVSALMADGITRTASDIVAQHIDGIASPSKATAILKAVEGISVEDIKVKGRTVKAYTLKA